MIKIINEGTMCNGCPECKNCGRNNEIDWSADLICDNCKNYVDELYDVDGDQLCESCLKLCFDKIDSQKALEMEGKA